MARFALNLEAAFGRFLYRAGAGASILMFVNVPVALLIYGILSVALVVARVYWSRMPTRLKSSLYVFTVASIAVLFVGYATGWTLISHRLNALLLWCGVAGYGLMLLRFTLLGPRWLTTAIAVILFLPVLSSSILLPLANLFTRSTGTFSVPLGYSLVSVRSPVTTPSAADLEIFYRPRWLPVIQRRMANVRFFDTQCLASASYAVLQPDHRSVLLSCPPAPTYAVGTPASGAIVPLR